MRRWLPLLFVAIMGDSPLWAVDKSDAGPVYTRRSEVDDDYAFQGEYTGYQRPLGSPRSGQLIGLHLVAQGQGEFLAVKYVGGLPGAGWDGDRANKYKLEARRDGGVVTVLGERFDFEITSNGAGRVLTREGNPAGEVFRVERRSPTLGALPPQGAVVLFNGTGTDQFRGARMTEDGLLREGCETRDAYNHFRLHGEFLLPYKPLGRGQNRGNSGFYLESRYELQVLDSFGLEGAANECGGIYTVKPPRLNMCLPPLQWQTYDIEFRTAQFDSAGNKTGPMRISVWHNGVPIHSHALIPNKTGAGKPEGTAGLPIKLQDHNNPVHYRNLWLIDLNQPGADQIPWLKLPPKNVPPDPISVDPRPLR